jgi:hypothetical protein
MRLNTGFVRRVVMLPRVRCSSCIRVGVPRGVSGNREEAGGTGGRPIGPATSTPILFAHMRLSSASLRKFAPFCTHPKAGSLFNWRKICRTNAAYARTKDSGHGRLLWQPARTVTCEIFSCADVAFRNQIEFCIMSSDNDAVPVRSCADANVARGITVLQLIFADAPTV